MHFQNRTSDRDQKDIIESTDDIEKPPNIVGFVPEDEGLIYAAKTDVNSIFLSYKHAGKA